MIRRAQRAPRFIRRTTSSIRCASVRGRSGHRPDCSEAGIVSGLRQRRTVRSLRDHDSLNRAIQRTSTLSAVRHRPKARITGGRVVTRVEAGEHDRFVAEVLRRAAAAAARSVHALRLGSAVGPFDAAKARRRARGTEAYSRADAGRDVARAAEEARRERDACRTLSREPPDGAAGPASISSGARRSCAKLLAGPLGPARRALKPFPQLGEAGAHRLLLFAADHPILPVDARLNRVGRRLGYGRRPPISRSRRDRSRPR